MKTFSFGIHVFNIWFIFSYVFFLAAYESSSTLMAFCLYELAKSPKLQQKVCTEIDNVLQNHGGKLTYDSLSEMKYFDKVIDGKVFKYNTNCIRMH